MITLLTGEISFNHKTIDFVIKIIESGRSATVSGEFMKFYVISNEKCAVTVSGVFIGIADGNLRYFEHCGHNLHVDFVPEDENYLPVSAFFPKPEAGRHGSTVSVKTDDGFILFPVFRTNVSPIVKRYYSKNFSGEKVGIALLCDPYPKIVVSSESDFFFTEPKYFSQNARAESFLCNNVLCVTIRAKRTFLYAFSIRPKIEIIYAEEIESVCRSDGHVVITKKIAGAIPIKIVEKRAETDFSLVQKTCERERSIYSIANGLIPYAFLDELHAGGNYSDYLSNKLKENASLIPDFFGRFLFYVPYFCGQTPYAALIHELRVDTVSFSLLPDGSICDFTFV